MVQTFACHGIRLDDAEVRRDMGVFKKDHIRRILQLPQVSITWSTKKGRRPGEHDIEKLFAEFGPVQMEVLGQYSQVIAGAAEMSEELQRRGLRVGSTTGYTRPMLDF